MADSNVEDAALMKRVKPPPVPQDLSTRRAVVLAFWAVALIGVPYWWSTTTIERRHLPVAQVDAWLRTSVSLVLVSSPRLATDCSRA